MAEQFNALQQDQIDFIGRQHIFFVGTAAQHGKVNVSPKGTDSLKVLDPGRVLWLNLTGSGNETAAHILDINRMTLMFCSFEKQPLILRLYGTAELIYPRHEKFQPYLDLFDSPAGTRQFYEMKIDMVQTSCGFAVPFMSYQGDRDTLTSWSEKKADQLPEYWKQNTTSLDGLPTAILEDVT